MCRGIKLCDYYYSFNWENIKINIFPTAFRLQLLLKDYLGKRKAGLYRYATKKHCFIRYTTPENLLDLLGLLYLFLNYFPRWFSVSTSISLFIKVFIFRLWNNCQVRVSAIDFEATMTLFGSLVSSRLNLVVKCFERTKSQRAA